MTLADQHLDLAGRTAAVRRWAAHHSQQSRAAAELLIWHDYWLRRSDFRIATTQYRPDDQMLVICWADAAAFATDARGSTSEIAILELAAAIGADRYRLAAMGSAHSAAIAHAVATAVGAAHQIGPAR